MLLKIKTHLLEIFMVMFLILFVDWSIGYYSNALMGTKFDLNSCWGGFSALGGSGVLAAIKYYTDSKLNSDDKKMPYIKEEELNNDK